MSAPDRPRTRQWAEQHPHLRGKTPAELVCMVPCAVHTDAGPCSKTNSCNCISWSSMLGTGGEKLTKFLVCSYLKHDNHGDAPGWGRLLQDPQHQRIYVEGLVANMLKRS